MLGISLTLDELFETLEHELFGASAGTCLLKFRFHPAQLPLATFETFEYADQLECRLGLTAEREIAFIELERRRPASSKLFRTDITGQLLDIWLRRRGVLAVTVQLGEMRPAAAERTVTAVDGRRVVLHIDDANRLSNLSVSISSTYQSELAVLSRCL